MFLIVLLTFVVVTFGQNGIHSYKKSVEDPCHFRPCKTGFICIQKTETQYLCLNETILRSLLHDAKTQKSANNLMTQDVKFSNTRTLNNQLRSVPQTTAHLANKSVNAKNKNLPRHISINDGNGNLKHTARGYFPLASMSYAESAPQSQTESAGNPLALSKLMPSSINAIPQGVPIHNVSLLGTPKKISTCYGSQSGENKPHPYDKRKFVICYNYGLGMVMNCPPHLVYNDYKKRCDLTDSKPELACLSNPCQNNAKCIDLSNFDFKCECTQGFTGLKCDKGEDPCSFNPCGPRGVCRTFGFLSTYVQYYCLCNNQREYGVDCDKNTFKNPCLEPKHDIYYPVEFSDSVFIQCEGNTINFKTCNPPLVWSQRIFGCDWNE